MNRRALEFINVSLFVLTVLGTNAIDLLGFTIGRTEKISISVVLIIIYLLIARQKHFEKVHAFQENSREFDKFFEKWYSRNGKLSIFCSDLDWLVGPEHAAIIQVLKQKSDKLYLYLRNNGKDPVSKQLVEGDRGKPGARLYWVKDSIKTQHRLSILDNDGIQSIIVRNKDIPSDQIVFVETDSYKDPYIIGLALDMLEDCYEK